MSPCVFVFQPICTYTALATLPHSRKVNCGEPQGSIIKNDQVLLYLVNATRLCNGWLHSISIYEDVENVTSILCWKYIFLPANTVNKYLTLQLYYIWKNSFRDNVHDISLEMLFTTILVDFHKLWRLMYTSKVNSPLSFIDEIYFFFFSKSVNFWYFGPKKRPEIGRNNSFQTVISCCFKDNCNYHVEFHAVLNAGQILTYPYEREEDQSNSKISNKPVSGPVDMTLGILLASRAWAHSCFAVFDGCEGFFVVSIELDGLFFFFCLMMTLEIFSFNPYVVTIVSFSFVLPEFFFLSLLFIEFFIFLLALWFFVAYYSTYSSFVSAHRDVYVCCSARSVSFPCFFLLPSTHSFSLYEHYDNFQRAFVYISSGRTEPPWFVSLWLKNNGKYDRRDNIPKPL